MNHPLLNALVERHGLPIVDEAKIDGFLASGDCKHALLFFSGAAAPRPETSDVAVLFPELLKAFAGKVRGAVVAPQAEAALQGRFQVFVFPSIAATREGQPVGVMAKVLDWSEYRAKIEAMLAPEAPILTGPQGPKTQFTRAPKI
jgi:hydrogenase-1 operon protein HyaE